VDATLWNVRTDPAIVVDDSIPGTHNGDFMGVPASGRQISVFGVGVFRVADGRVAEFWVSRDRISLLQQLGVLPVQAWANVGARS